MTEHPTVTGRWNHRVLNPHDRPALLVEHPGLNDRDAHTDFADSALFAFEEFALLTGERSGGVEEVHMPPDFGLLSTCERVDRMTGGDALVQAYEALPYPWGDVDLAARCVQAAMDSGRYVRLVVTGRDRSHGWIFLLRAEDLPRALELAAEDIAAWKRRGEE